MASGLPIVVVAVAAALTGAGAGSAALCCEVITAKNFVIGSEQVGWILGAAENGATATSDATAGDVLAGPHALALECAFEVRPSQPGLVTITVVGSAAAAGDAAVQKTSIDCYVLDADRNLVLVLSATAAGPLATDTEAQPRPANGPFVFCAAAEADFADSHMVWYGPACVHPETLV